MWNSFPPYFSSTHTISLYAKAARARHLPKSAANFELKGKQKKAQESAGHFIIHLLKDTPNVPTALETPELPPDLSPSLPSATFNQPHERLNLHTGIICECSCYREAHAARVIEGTRLC